MVGKSQNSFTKLKNMNLKKTWRFQIIWTVFDELLWFKCRKYAIVLNSIVLTLSSLGFFVGVRCFLDLFPSKHYKQFYSLFLNNKHNCIKLKNLKNKNCIWYKLFSENTFFPVQNFNNFRCLNVLKRLLALQCLSFLTLPNCIVFRNKAVC